QDAAWKEAEHYHHGKADVQQPLSRIPARAISPTIRNRRPDCQPSVWSRLPQANILDVCNRFSRYEPPVVRRHFARRLSRPTRLTALESHAEEFTAMTTTPGARSDASVATT